MKDHLQKLWRRNYGELPKYYVSDNHEPIIDQSVFDQVQVLLRERASKFNPYPHASAPYPFTKMIICGQCGANYKRKMSKGKASWNCSTYLTQGKQFCHAKQIPEDTLLAMTVKVLQKPVFDERLFKEKVMQIRVPAFYRLVYVFKDDTKVECVWQDRSRSDSWSEDMKLDAAEYARRRYEK